MFFRNSNIWNGGGLVIFALPEARVYARVRAHTHKFDACPRKKSGKTMSDFKYGDILKCKLLYKKSEVFNKTNPEHLH